MGALIPLLLPFAPAVLQFMEKAFAGKPKSGPDKIATGIRVMGQVAEGLLNAKAPLPDGSQVQQESVKDDVIRGLLEAELTRLKVTGALDVTPPVGTLFLVRGVVVPLDAKL